MSKAKHLRGIVRIAKHDGINWYGFTLRKNHLYGETENGLRFVSACRVDKYGDIIVHVQTNADRLAWGTEFFAQESDLGVKIIEKCKERDQAGGDRVIVPVMPSTKSVSRMMSSNCRYMVSSAKVFA